jgi:AmiR/NasT family two-component response regulator
MLLHGQAGAVSGEMDRELDEAFHHRAEVYQAQGMVQVQLGVSLEEAMVRLRAHAFVQGRTLVEVAADVVARRLILERDET